MSKKTNPYEVEMLDLWDEVGGQMVIKYHRATIKPDKGDLQQLRDKGFKTDIMTCIIANVGAHLGDEKAMAFLEEAATAGASPSVAFEAPEGEALYIKNKKENPLFDVLVQAAEHQE